MLSHQGCIYEGEWEFADTVFQELKIEWEGEITSGQKIPGSGSALHNRSVELRVVK